MNSARLSSANSPAATRHSLHQVKSCVAWGHFVDNVSGCGLDILDIVAQWYESSFADRSAELHDVLSSEDPVMVRYTFHGRHTVRHVYDSPE
ncbi:hypothetical protein ACFQZZ_01935 [Nocardia sp. GCM10030253]|uniref:hypothetical protein n=1 Tax=Nocardia sp. GCM10030253 TaxID=3273404 RepID=UPI0036341829